MTTCPDRHRDDALACDLDQCPDGYDSATGLMLERHRLWGESAVTFFVGVPMLDERMTAEEFANLPDDAYRHELSGGLLLAEPFPTPLHDRIRQKLEHLLLAFVEPRCLGEVFGYTGFVLARDPDTVRGPDVSFVSKQRLVGFDDARYFPGAPDLAVEILSPSNRPGEMHAKVADYLAAGARMVWVIDPERRLVTTYRELLAPRCVAPPAELDGEDVLPGLKLPLDAFLPPRE